MDQCKHDWEIVRRHLVKSLVRECLSDEYRFTIIDGYEKLQHIKYNKYISPSDLRTRDAMLLFGVYNFKTFDVYVDRVCLECGQCEYAIDQFKKATAKRVEHITAEIERQELAMKMWKEGCH